MFFRYADDVAHSIALRLFIAENDKIGKSGLSARASGKPIAIRRKKYWNRAGRV